MPELTVGDLAKSALADRGDQLRWAAARLPLAGDEEAVHDCRVALRRLREVWMAFGDHLQPSPKRQVREMRTSERRLGPLRDAEVRAALMDEVLGPLAVAVDRSDDPTVIGGGEVGQLRPGLRGREQEARRRLAEATAQEIAGQRNEMISHRLIRELGDLSAQGRTGDSADVPALQLALVQLPKMFAAAGRQRRGADQLHRRRIVTRRLRYRLEVFGPVLPDQHRMVLAELRRLQGQLGRVHDLSVLVEWLDRAARAEAPTVRAALRRLVVRTELEEQAAVEAAELEVRSLDAGGWWRSAELACLGAAPAAPRRRRH